MANNQTFTLNIKALFDASDVKAKVGDIQNALKNIKLPDDLKRSLDSSFTNVNKALDDFNSKVNKGVKSKSDASGITKAFDNVTKELDNLDKLMSKVKGELGDGVDLSKIIKIDDSTRNKVQQLKQEIVDLQKEISKVTAKNLNGLQAELQKLKSPAASKGGKQALELFEQGDVQGAINLLDQLIAKQQQVQAALQAKGSSTTNVEQNIEALKQMKTTMESVLPDVQTYNEQIGNKAAQASELLGNAQQQTAQKTRDLADGLHETAQAANGVTNNIRDTTAAQAQLNREIDQVKSRIQYFFGINNAINLIKRAVRGAVNTIKDLDKAMTATAVVTNYTIQDMWKQLPDYTKRANELGVTTQDAYEAATLYFQQGLNADQAAALSTETLKMARIAGLDAAEATDRMTNALRGFNMELDAVNAQKVDDVYSQLAAMSASNVDEISTAMTKVASLAHNANMEFETTAAFLAQIIETTRESAETAGTALKTVVARFSEVKKLYSEDQLKGTDEEGQGIDVNKISTALRTAGIDLNKYFLGEVGLDDIFMELASKWDSLTSVQQRYIATQAAGSRQQSRFIALMQDYARTQELVSAAYKANGASAKQFEKTQDSLQSKLARLKNAWNEFLMGLANSVIVKTVVDGLTLLLNTVNNLTSAFGNGIGTILKWGTVLLGLKGLRSIFSDTGIATKAIGAFFKGTPLEGFLGKKGGGAALETSAVTAGNTLVAAAQEAATILTGGATAAAETEVTGAAAEESIENAGATTEEAIENAGAVAEEDIEVAGAVAEEAIENGVNNSFKGFAQTVLSAGTTKGVAKSGGATVITGASSAPAVVSQAAGTGATGALSAAAVPAAVIAAVVAAVVGTVAIQDYLKSGKKEVKEAEKAVEAQQQAAEKQKEIATLQKDAYNKYLENEKLLNSSTNSVEQANAKAAMAEALATLAGIDQKNVNISDTGTTLNTTYAKQLAENLEQEENLTKASGSFAQATLQMAQAAKAEKSILQKQDNGTYQSASWWHDLQWGWKNSGAYGAQGFSNTVVEQYNAEQQAKAASYTAAAMPELMSAAASLLQGKYGQDIIDSTSAVYSKLFNADSLQEQIKNISGVGRIGGRDNFFNKENLIEQYEAIYGIGSAEGLNANQLSTILAQRQVTTEQEQKVQQLADFAMTSVGSQLIEALNGNIEIDEESIKFKDEIAELASIFGKQSDDIKAELKRAKEIRRKQKEENASNIFEKAIKSNIPIDKTLTDQINNLSPELTKQISDIVNQAFGTISDEGFGKLLTSLVDNSLNTNQIKEIQDFYNNFNLDNPIQAFHQLSQAQQEVADRANTDPFKRMLTNIEETNKEIFSTSNLLQTFITSANYDSLTDSLEKFIEANGRVTSENIEELADSCTELQYLLEDTELTVQGLAEAFTLLETGVIAFDALTSSLLSALSAGESFETLIDNVSAWIKNFSEGTDLTEGTEHIVDVAKKASEYIENWQFGNEPLENIYDHLFGEGAFNKYMSSNYPDRGFDQIEADLKSKVEQVSQWAENEGLGALQSLANGYGGGLTGLTQLDDQGLQFEWDLSSFETTKDAIEAVGTALGVTDDAARAFIESWGSHMWDLRQDWNNLNFGEQMQGFAKGLGDGVAITKAELDGLSAATGKTSNEILAELQKIKGEAYIPIVVNWQDSNGANLTGQALFDQFDKTFKTFNPTSLSNDFSQFLNDIINGANIDATQLMNKLTSELKMSDSQASEVADHIVQSTGGKLTKEIEVPVVTKLDEDSFEVTSESITIEAGSMSDLTAAADAALEAANAQMISDMLASNDYAGLTNAVTGALESGGTAGAAAVQSALNAISVDIPISWHWTNGPPSFDIGASGGIVKSYASGSAANSLNPGVALTGEEGPEIIWNKNKGYAYVTGKQHPEFRSLQPGDRVFNAQETRKILHGAAKGGLVDSFASGGWKPPASSSKSGGGSSGGSGGKGGKDKTPEEWKNELDWLYNLMEDIAELERDQKAIEEQYEDLLTDQTKTGKDLYNLLIKQLGNLYTQLNHQTFALEKREQEMREFMDITNDKDEYLWYNWQDRTIEIDWDAIDQITDEEEYKHVKELIDEAEEIQDKMDDADDAIMDIMNQIQELENIWRDTFVDFEDRVLDAVVKSYQTVIDNYSELNDTLNNSNQQILDSLQKEINLQRQIRDNTKTEEEITDEEARLAYLRRDTTGGNELAALQLQKELDDQRRSYEDTLVDQAVERLQEDNDAAAQQRERQIEIMQAQLDYQSENGEFNAYISDLLTTAMGADGELLTNSDLVTLLKEQENWDAMSAVSKQVWDEELNSTFKEVAAFLLKQNAEENGTYVTALTTAVQGVSSAIGSYSQAITKLGNDIASMGSSGGYSGSGGGNDGSDDDDKTIVIKGTADINIGKSTYSNGWTPSKGGYWRSYDTGGMASYTGPAWLDGTPNEPEYVLNARQTDAFLKLADVLPSMMGTGGAISTNTFGSTYFNVSVNVDNVSSDYDVDRMVDRIKDKLYETGSYRNVNSLSFLR